MRTQGQLSSRAATWLSQTTCDNQDWLKSRLQALPLSCPVNVCAPWPATPQPPPPPGTLPAKPYPQMWRIWGGRASGRWWGHEEGDLLNGSSALMRYGERLSFCQSEHMGRRWASESKRRVLLEPWSQTSSLQKCELLRQQTTVFSRQSESRYPVTSLLPSVHPTTFNQLPLTEHGLGRQTTLTTAHFSLMTALRSGQGHYCSSDEETET